MPPFVLSLLEGLRIVLTCVILAVAGGMLWVTLAQSQRSRLIGYYLVQWSCLAGWAFSSLLVAGLDLNPLAVWGIARLGLSLILVGVWIYYLILVEIAQVGRFFRAVAVLLLVFMFINLAALWFGNGYSGGINPLTAQEYGFQTLDYLLGGAEILTLAVGFWAVMTSNTPQAHGLRLLAFLTLLAAGLLAFPSVVALVASHFLLMTVVVWFGWITLQQQLFTPLEGLTKEFEVTNSDLKRALNELARERSRVDTLTRELQAANEQKTNFLATMSHELRTPLNSIVGYSEMLVQGIYGSLTQQQQDRLEKIERNSRSLLEVITNILDLSKIESGRLELDLRPFNVAEVVREVCEEFAPHSARKSLELSIQVDQDLLDLVADRQRIGQILRNLVDNGIKFTPEGFVKIHARKISVHKGKSIEFQLPVIGWLSDGAWILLSVEDSGIGIAPENQAIIFEEFSQVDSSRTREYEGSGLGLTITRRLVELHGGTIWVRSNLNTGSQFHVALPSAQALETVDYGYRDVLGKF